MKKLLTALIVMAVAISTQAASFNWGTGTVSVKFDSTAVTTGTGYLVLLGSGSLSDLYSVDYTAPGTITPAGSVDSSPTISTGLPVLLGRISDTYQADSIANGQVYGMYIIYNDGTDTWYNFGTSTYTVSGLENATSTLGAANFAFDFNTKTEITADGMTPSGWTKINIPVTPVPEPATGALALAGIALLFKRRKA